jgi:hypothetical protein
LAAIVNDIQASTIGGRVRIGIELFGKLGAIGQAPAFVVAGGAVRTGRSSSTIQLQAPYWALAQNRYCFFQLRQRAPNLAIRFDD